MRIVCSELYKNAKKYGGCAATSCFHGGPALTGNSIIEAVMVTGSRGQADERVEEDGEEASESDRRVCKEGERDRAWALWCSRPLCKRPNAIPSGARVVGQ